MDVEELLEKYAAGERDFPGVDLSEANLRGVNLSGVNLSQANLSVTNLSGANLSRANLSGAKLNVARLSGVNLTLANLNNASLNVANLIRANLSGAQLVGATLIRAELIRADLSRANLSDANLSGADLREATLRQANLRHADLSEANLRGSLLLGANLERAHLNVTNLSRADLSGANLRDAELRQVNLSRANMNGANLIRANLRWTDLSGANLSWADLNSAKLSGGNLIGADLSNASLLNASLVHADLTQANLIKADWSGADLTGATLTGAKLYGVSRFGLKTENVICEWIDLSPDGNNSLVQKFTPEESQAFFNETPPTIQLVIDAALDQQANWALATAYYEIAQQYPLLKQPPSIEVGSRRTILTFRINSEEYLFAIACIVILPFRDAIETQRNIHAWVQVVTQDPETLGFRQPQRVQQLNAMLGQAMAAADGIKLMNTFLLMAAKSSFFQAPTQTILVNSSDRKVTVHNHPNFGKQLTNPTGQNKAVKNLNETPRFVLPPLSVVVDFVKEFHQFA